MQNNKKKKNKQQEILLSCVADLERLGNRGLNKSVKKGNIVTIFFFFSDDLERSFQKLCKMISADVKSNVKQCDKYNNWWLYLIRFCKKYLQNVNYIVKKLYSFNLILLCISSSLILSVKNSG